MNSKPDSILDIDNEIAAYETMRDDLEAHHMGKGVVLREGKLLDSSQRLDWADVLTAF